MALEDRLAVPIHRALFRRAGDALSEIRRYLQEHAFDFGFEIDLVGTAELQKTGEALFVALVRGGREHDQARRARTAVVPVDPLNRLLLLGEPLDEAIVLGGLQFPREHAAAGG